MVLYLLEIYHGGAMQCPSGGGAVHLSSQFGLTSSADVLKANEKIAVTIIAPDKIFLFICPTPPTYLTLQINHNIQFQVRSMPQRIQYVMI